MGDTVNIGKTLGYYYLYLKVGYIQNNNLCPDSHTQKKEKMTIRHFIISVMRTNKKGDDN